MSDPTLAQPRNTRDAIRSAIFDHDDVPARLVKVSEWHGEPEFEVRGLTVADQSEYFQRMAAADTEGTDEKSRWAALFPHLLTATVFLPYYSPEGVWERKVSKEGVFDGEADAAALLTRSSIAVGKLTRMALFLSGLREDDPDAGNAPAETE